MPEGLSYHIVVAVVAGAARVVAAGIAEQEVGWVGTWLDRGRILLDRTRWGSYRQGSFRNSTDFVISLSILVHSLA